MIRREEFIHALGTPDAGFEDAVNAALRRVKEREARPIMKRKMTLTMLAAVIAVIALTGAALAVGLNLFEYFGDHDPRLIAVAPEATVEAAFPGEIVTDALGVTNVRVGNAYYDGRSLIVAYTVENYQRRDSYAPTEVELKAMTASDTPFAIVPDEQSETESSHPFGTVTYEVFPADSWYADDGTLLPVYAETIDQGDDGAMICLREFETPLPEAARSLDSLTLRVPMKLFTTWRYFDGEKFYEKQAQEPVTELCFTVNRTNAVTRGFAGNGELNGAPVNVKAQVSAVHVKLHIEGAFPHSTLTDDTWLSFILEDSTGRAFRISSSAVDESAVDLEYDGLGYLPDELTLTVCIDGEGEWDADAHVLPGCPITLKPE